MDYLEWYAIKIWYKNLQYDAFLLDFVKPTVETLKNRNLIKRWFFLFEKNHINFHTRVESGVCINQVEQVINDKITHIKLFLDKKRSPNPEPFNYSGEAGKYGKDGWEIVQKFFECGSEFALCRTDPTKEKIVPSTGEGFNEEKLVHCFLNQTGYLEHVFYIKRLLELGYRLIP